MITLLFILFILLILIISFIYVSIKSSSATLRSSIGGAQNNLETNKDAMSMQVRSRTNSIEFDRHGKFNKVEFVRAIMTYTISGEGNGLDFSQLRGLLSQCSRVSFIEKPVSERVHYSIGGLGSGCKDKYGRFWDISPLFVKQHASIKNFLDDHSGFIGKNELYKTIKRLIPLGIQYIPPTYTIKEFDTLFLKGLTPKLFDSNNLETNSSEPRRGAERKIRSDQIYPVEVKGVRGQNMQSIQNPPYILKKIKTSHQEGVKVIESKESYFQAKKELGINDDNAVMSEYIANPMLVDGKKFHLRIYFLISVILGITRCAAHDEYRVITAKEKYKYGDWLNPKIHISGGHDTDKRYKWPDDIDYNKEKAITNLQACIDVICLALTLSGIKKYEETNAGYQLYGADILITDDYKIYILEINRRPRFDTYGEKEGWGEYNKRFSHHLFSFILNHTVFPHFGITRWPIQSAEFIGNGILSKYANILTGKNRCTLIPDATDAEIEVAKKFHFYNKISPLDHFISNEEQFFLIGYGSKEIIGYLVLNSSDALNHAGGLKEEKTIEIAIIKEYQNRGIATAMIAQLLEILSAIAYVDHKNPKIYIKSRNPFLFNIANKLFFTINSNNYYERTIKYKGDNYKRIIDINNNKLLTYKIIHHSKYNIDLISHIEPHMVYSNSQFVNFLFNLLDENAHITELSTGVKYNETFIYQGAELKSTLQLKILWLLETFKRWYYTHFTECVPIFNKFANLDKLEPNKKYRIYEYNIRKISIINGSDIDNSIKSEKLEDGNYRYSIEEYNEPFLMGKKLMILRCYLMIYVSGNGVIKCFCFDTKKPLIANANYSIDKINEIDINVPNYNTSPIYNWPDDFKNGEIAHIANDDTIIDNCIKTFMDILLMYDGIKPYNEANAGFLNIVIDLEFNNILKHSDNTLLNENNKYIPIVRNAWNWTKLANNKITNDQFIKDYYLWIKKSVIYPHFGLSPSIEPMAIKINNSKLDASIIKKLSVHFEKNRELVIISYNGEKIGDIKLNLLNASDATILMSNIEITPHHRKKGIALHSIFMLMDIIAAYYAPTSMSLMFDSAPTEMHSIAYKLEFQKTSKNYFIRRCRL